MTHLDIIKEHVTLHSYNNKFIMYIIKAKFVFKVADQKGMAHLMQLKDHDI